MRFRSFFSVLSILYHYTFFKIRNFGSNNLTLGNGVLLWKSKIISDGENNNIILGSKVKFESTILKVRGNNNKVLIGENVTIYESCEIIIEGNNCEINIGSRTTIGSAQIFCGESNTSIIIGENCMIGRKVSINTSDFHSIIEKHSGLRINVPRNIIIGEFVWVGYDTSISKGAVISNSSVIASRSFVPGKEFPSNSIIAGIPAKVIKENITWSREKLPY